MAKKDKVMVTIDGDIRRQAKQLAGLIPFSRYIEDLIRKEIDRHNKEEQG